MLRAALLAAASLGLSVLSAAIPESRHCESARYEAKHRAFILTDMSNEPDDQMSLVRLLTYANEIDIRGIAGVTSVWKNSSIDAQTIRLVIGAYGNITSSLNANVPEAAAYPSGEELLSRVSVGHPVYGLASLPLNASEAALALIKEADAASPTDPLWVQCWGGAGVIAEAMNHVQNTRSANATASFINNIRVYSISDQDDAGPWIRQYFPKLFYIVSLHSMNEYSRASWNGISGELYRHFDKGGPDSSLVTNDWLQQHIRIGELGQHYPNFTFIMEGDTPSFFPLINNGLGDPEHPEWGSWGGRWKLLDASARVNVFTDASDFVLGLNNETYLTSFGTIWRWRREYQYDFAARMQWALGKKYEDINHAPVAILNASCGPEIITMNYNIGDTVVLDASKSWDPDGDELSFHWWHYRDPNSYSQGGDWDPVSKDAIIKGLDEKNSVVAVTPVLNGMNDGVTHLILQVSDGRDMELTTYRRVIMYPIY